MGLVGLSCEEYNRSLAWFTLLKEYETPSFSNLDFFQCVSRLKMETST